MTSKTKNIRLNSLFKKLTFTKSGSSWLDPLDTISFKYYFEIDEIQSSKKCNYKRLVAKDVFVMVLSFNKVEYLTMRNLSESYLHMQDDGCFKYKILRKFCSQLQPCCTNMQLDCITKIMYKVAIPTGFNLVCNNTPEPLQPIYKSLQASKNCNIYVSWIMLWCLTFNQLIKFDKEYRFDQLISVLSNLNLNLMGFLHWNSVYKEVISTVSKHGTDQMVFNIISFMNSISINRTPEADRAIFDLILNTCKTKDSGKLKASPTLAKTHEDLVKLVIQKIDPESIKYAHKSLDSSSGYNMIMKNNCRRRTFKDSENSFNWLIQDTVSISLNTKCSGCTLKINVFDCIGIGKCPSCEAKFYPELSITQGLKIESLDSTIQFKRRLIQLSELQYQIGKLYQRVVENGQAFNLKILREEYDEILWNCVFYFTYCDLPYDFLLCYESDQLIMEYNQINLENKIELFDPDE